MGAGAQAVIAAQTTTPLRSRLRRRSRLNRDFLGGFTGRIDARTADSIVHSIPNPSGWPSGAVFGGPAYWEGPDTSYVFFTSAGRPLRRYRLDLNPNGAGSSALIPDGQSTDRFGLNGAPEAEKFTPTPVLSSNGHAAGTGIVWLLRRDDGTLRAYNAETLALLWHSKQNAADALGLSVVKFTVPIVANGKVYAGTKGSIVCYGERQ